MQHQISMQDHTSKPCLLVSPCPCLLPVHFLPGLNYLFSTEFVYSLTALASRKQCVGLLPLAALSLSLYLLLLSNPAPPAAVSSSYIASCICVFPSTRMQSIKLARFCSSSLCATLLTVFLLPHFVTVHAAAAAAPAAALAGQQFP